MATTTKRVNISTRTQKNDSMEVNGWKLNFQYSFEEGKPVKDVQVNGNFTSSELGGTQPYVSYSKNGTSTNISFNNTECDNELVAAIKAEVDLITAG
jgi:hypothetical protein